MKALRKILMPLLAIPLGMFLYVFTHPDWQGKHAGLESLFAVIGIPVLIANFIAWFYPEIIKAYFPVREDGGERRSASIGLAIAASALVALICVSAGAVSSASDVRARPTVKPSVQPPATALAYARSGQMYPDTINSGESDIVTIPSFATGTNIAPEQAQALQAPETTTASELTPQATETSIPPEQTPQIPVSGRAETVSPTFSATSTGIPATSTQPASTASLPASCSPATQDDLDAIMRVVQGRYLDNGVRIGWAMQSTEVTGLWFVAARISGPGIDTNMAPGVWGLFITSQGDIDIYSVNAIAMGFSDAQKGEESVPVLAMQSDGAQAAYDCAVNSG